MILFCFEMAIKVTKGHICDGTTSKNTCHHEYYLCGKFYGLMKKCTIFGFCRCTIGWIYFPTQNVLSVKLPSLLRTMFCLDALLLIRTGICGEYTSLTISRSGNPKAFTKLFQDICRPSWLSFQCQPTKRYPNQPL